MAGQKIKGNMVCKRCGPTVAVRQTHGVRNTLGWGGAPLTGGLSLFVAAKPQSYMCQQCGGPVLPMGKGAFYKVRCPECGQEFRATKGFGRQCPHCNHVIPWVNPRDWPLVA